VCKTSIYIVSRQTRKLCGRTPKRERERGSVFLRSRETEERKRVKRKREKKRERFEDVAFPLFFLPAGRRRDNYKFPKPSFSLIYNDNDDDKKKDRGFLQKLFSLSAFVRTSRFWKADWKYALNSLDFLKRPRAQLLSLLIKNVSFLSSFTGGDYIIKSRWRNRW